MYGTQTSRRNVTCGKEFENDVKMYGTQTVSTLIEQSRTFENDVKMYGTQTEWKIYPRKTRLRMM